MSKLAINKSSLKKQRDQLKLFQRFLPSLDLKRQQLMTEIKRSEQQLAEAEEEIRQLGQSLTGLMGAARRVRSGTGSAGDHRPGRSRRGERCRCATSGSLGGQVSNCRIFLTGDGVRGGFTLRTTEGGPAGIRVRVVGEQVQLDLTEGALADLLALHPRFREVLRNA